MSVLSFLMFSRLLTIAEHITTKVCLQWYMQLKHNVEYKQVREHQRRAPKKRDRIWKPPNKCSKVINITPTFPQKHVFDHLAIVC